MIKARKLIVISKSLGILSLFVMSPQWLWRPKGNCLALHSTKKLYTNYHILANLTLSSYIYIHFTFTNHGFRIGPDLHSGWTSMVKITYVNQNLSFTFARRWQTGITGCFQASCDSIKILGNIFFFCYVNSHLLTHHKRC